MFCNISRTLTPYSLLTVSNKVLTSAGNLELTVNLPSFVGAPSSFMLIPKPLRANIVGLPANKGA